MRVHSILEKSSGGLGAAICWSIKVSRLGAATPVSVCGCYVSECFSFVHRQIEVFLVPATHRDQSKLVIGESKPCLSAWNSLEECRVIILIVGYEISATASMNFERLHLSGWHCWFFFCVVQSQLADLIISATTSGITQSHTVVMGQQTKWANTWSGSARLKTGFPKKNSFEVFLIIFYFNNFFVFMIFSFFLLLWIFSSATN